jgi:hypothetical protein
MDGVHIRPEGAIAGKNRSAAVPAAVVAASRRHCLQRLNIASFCSALRSAGEAARATAGETPALPAPENSIPPINNFDWTRAGTPPRVL